MEGGNETVTTDFILSGLFPNVKYVSILIYTIILIYLVAVTRNFILLFLIWIHLRLHTPMYFLLSQLSLVDLAFISSTVPKMMINFLSGRKNITHLACGTQIFFFFTLGGAECILLTLMAYNRYVSVCHPLRYVVIMNHRVCLQMALVSWIGGILASTAHTTYTMSLPICGSREIYHSFCEMPTIMKISCKDTSTYELVVFVMGIAFIIVPFGLIMASYSFIFLTAVSVFCTVLTPMLNPLNYSLRNKDVVGAFQKILRKHPFLGGFLYSGRPTPTQSQGDIGRNNNTGGGQLSSPKVSSHMKSCSSHSGCRVAGASLLSCVLPPPIAQGDRQILGFVTPGPGLLGLRHWNHSPRAAPSPPRRAAARATT
ncbi:unnamed protein product [Nyctereutes procyonoides]|uniref:Olfactory receptor n=1 Tax=Nyctereutes procyonoides TaxID=34880 RepID=A0A811XSJ3_NYCPR|nr:unnamed protein product [Nyctereutes procyonoides]